MNGDIYRIFYCGRDTENRSSVGAVDVDVLQRRIIADHPFPFFENGSEESFFSDGVSIGNCYEAKGVRYVLFMGWQNHTGKHWRGEIGRLVITPELNLMLDSSEPLLGTDSDDPFSLSYPWVRQREDGSFDMWYGSTQTWDAGNGEMLHVIKHATSCDGERWNKTGLAVSYELGVTQAFSRPTVARGLNGGLEMWFSYRGSKETKYSIGYATSPNGEDWSLDLDGAGIATSSKGWDSEMIEYPFVFDHKNERYMLYNGNGFGKSGFGMARLKN